MLWQRKATRPNLWPDLVYLMILYAGIDGLRDCRELGSRDASPHQHLWFGFDGVIMNA